MKNSQKSIVLAISGAFALSAVALAHAADNPFALKTFSQGYTVADKQDGKCNTGSCSNKNKKAKKAKMGKDMPADDKKDMSMDDKKDMSMDEKK